MAEQILHINVRPVWARLPLALLALVAIWAGWNAVRWGVGDTMAEYAPVSYAQDPLAALETAESAARLAPDDPLTHLTLARLHRVSFDPVEVPRALAEYDRAAALAPNDYLIWMEVGRARVGLGDPEGGIAALKHAVALAPSYSEPRWHLGNALLRAGRMDEAFAELRRAADADPTLRPQVFNLAWQVYAQDLARVTDAVGKTPAARAQLVGVLVGRGLYEEAIKVWTSLNAEERREQAVAGEGLARSLYDRGKFTLALRALAESGAQGASVGKVSNGSFESDIGQQGAQIFQWQISPGPVQVAVDTRVAREGQRSLRLLFNASRQADFRNVWQTVVVQPSTRYRLSYFVRTDDLRSVATLMAVVSDAAAPDAPALGSSAQVPAGTNEWQQMTVDFATAPGTEAIMIRLVRVGCAEEVCPIFGKIWYDDFDLQRSGGRAAQQ